MNAAHKVQTHKAFRPLFPYARNSMIQVSITIDRAHLDRVERTLLDHGAQSVSLRDAADHPVLEPPPGETPLWPRVIVTGLFTDAAETETLRRSLNEVLDGDPSPHSELLPERDWVRAWLDDFKPMRFRPPPARTAQRL